MTKYNYKLHKRIDDADSLKEAIEISIINYMYHQLGWSIEQCEKRIEKEIIREIPKDKFDQLEANWSWNIKGKKVLDVGSGQGAGVLEALERGADAYGIEPGAEFVRLSRMRLDNGGYNGKEKILEESAEKLPFTDNEFDYIISLQVLEHVENPEPILNEMFRVLKPGGKCYVSCENYLSFKEQHYRISWFPLLPKWIGSLYLRAIGRDPSFLKNYVYYTTYPQVWQLCKKAGFKNLTYKEQLDKLEKIYLVRSRLLRFFGSIIGYLPNEINKDLVRYILHLKNFMTVGVQFILEKPLDN